MGFRPVPEWLRVLGMALLLLPLLLLAWFFPDISGVFGNGAAERRKPLSAEAKFFRLVAGVLLVVGGLSWWLWRRFGGY